MIMEMKPWSVTIQGDPKSKPRPRLGANGRIYSPKGDEEVTAILLRQAWRGTPNATDAFCVTVGFHTANYQRRDIDNMIKLLFDAANGIVWDDDSQVVELAVEDHPSRPESAD